MKEFTFSYMNRSSGAVLDEALKEPVALTKRGKEKLVIITAEHYHRLVGRPRAKAFTMENAPAAVANDLADGLKAFLEKKETPT